MQQGQAGLHGTALRWPAGEIILRAAAHPSRCPGNPCKACRGTFHLRTVLNAERKKLRPYRLYRGKKEKSSRSRTNCYDNTSRGCRGPLTLGNKRPRVTVTRSWLPQGREAQDSVSRRANQGRSIDE